MPPRTHWYSCPHWQRFLVRSTQHCALCEPLPQQPTARLPKWRGSFKWQIEAKINDLQAEYANLRAESAKPDG